MYQEQGAKVGVPVSKETVFENTIQRLEIVNDQREKMLYEIESKIHSIYNQRAPENRPEPGTDKPMDSDFLSKIHRQIGRAESDNSKISKILEHLNLIV